MALIDPQERRKVAIPHEEGQWVELRPITARDLITVQRKAVAAGSAVQFENTVRMLLECLTAWSYPKPITEENLLALEYVTLTWLDDEMFMAGTRTDEEKKTLDSPSPPTSDPETEDSLPSLPTSRPSRGSRSAVS